MGGQKPPMKGLSSKGQVEECRHQVNATSVRGPMVTRDQEMKSQLSSTEGPREGVSHVHLPPVGKWIKKWWCIQTANYYSVLKRSKLPGHDETGRVLSGILLIPRERSQSEKAAEYMVPTVSRSGNGKTG